MGEGRSYAYGRQTIDEEDIARVAAVLRGEWITQGPAVGAFEAALGRTLDVRHAVAVSNGTAALHLVGLALGWQPGDVVITSPITFLASANCIVYAGAVPSFADVDPETITLDPAAVEAVIRKHREAGARVRALIGVDYAGLPCDWPGLRELAHRYDLQLVSDACHALGARFQGGTPSPCDWVDAAVLSFHPVKHITTGEGGAVLTNDPALAERVRTLRTHGIRRDAGALHRDEGPWYYEMHELGFNYRLTDFQCALGLSQLAKLPGFLQERRRVAAFYDRAFAGDSRFTLPARRPDTEHAYHLYPLQVRFDAFGTTRRALFQRLLRKQIRLQVHYIPVHFQPYYQDRYGFRDGDFPVAEDFYRREVSLPVYPGLEEDDLSFIVGAFRDALAGD